MNKISFRRVDENISIIHMEYTLDWSQYSVFLVVICRYLQRATACHCFIEQI